MVRIGTIGVSLSIFDIELASFEKPAIIQFRKKLTEWTTEAVVPDILLTGIEYPKALFLYNNKLYFTETAFPNTTFGFGRSRHSVGVGATLVAGSHTLRDVRLAQTRNVTYLTGRFLL